MLIDKKISIVVVCYQDEGNIREMYKRLSEVMPKITPDYEIIYVNDGSPDESEQILNELAGKDGKLTVINHSRNFGAQAAFTSGMRQALGDAVVIMDGDLQDPPELILEFVKKWIAGYDVVYGVREKREASLGRLNEFFYRLFYFLFNKLAYVPVPRNAGEFSLMDRKVVDHINSLPETDRFIRGLRAWVGHKQTGLPFARPERFWGRSTGGFLANIRWAKKAVFSFSNKPLEWVSYLAILFLSISALGIIFYIASYFVFPDAPKGITTIIVLVLFLGGIQLLTLSFIAEYIARIFVEVKRRHNYVIREVLNDHRKKPEI